MARKKPEPILFQGYQYVTIWPRLSVRLSVNGLFYCVCDRVAEAMKIAIAKDTPKGLAVISFKLPRLQGVTNDPFCRSEEIRLSRWTLPGKPPGWVLESSYN